MSESLVAYKQTSGGAAGAAHRESDLSDPEAPRSTTAAAGPVIVRKKLDGKDFITLSPEEHVYHVPDTYVGSIVRTQHTDWIYDFKTKAFTFSKISTSDGMKRLFLEVISNAADAIKITRNGLSKAKLAGSTESLRIEVSVSSDRRTMSVTNYGEPVPVELNKERIPVPEAAFGRLRTSTNYDTTIVRTGAGRNGYGSKLVNIFSKLFKVRVVDTIKKKVYEGVWENNMMNLVSSAILTSKDKNYADIYKEMKAVDGDVTTSSVTLTWTLDFDRLNKNIETMGQSSSKTLVASGGSGSYSSEDLACFARLLFDFSFTSKIPVSFDGTVYNFSNINNYATLYLRPELMTKTYWYSESSSGLDSKKSITLESLVSIEFFVVERIDAGGDVLSFVNGLMTSEGGAHVNEVLSKICAPIIKHFATPDDPLGGQKKLTLTNNDIKQHLFIIVSASIPNPIYNSQSKTRLAEPKVRLNNFSEDDFMRKVKSWSLLERLGRSMDAKTIKLLKASDGKKTRYVDVENLVEANRAGTAESQRCVLYVVEGISASSYPAKRITGTKYSDGSHGRDYGGYYSLRGKFLNISDLPLDKLAKYQGYVDIKSILGLQEDMDYTSDHNASKLRYGKLIITTDADSDGKHILSLLLNVFHKRWPSLLRRMMIAYLATPVVKVFSGTERTKCTHRFFTEKDFEDWLNSGPNMTKGKKVVYYKGLGSSLDDEIVEDISYSPVVTCLYDSKAAESLGLAFNSALTDARKEWIQAFRDTDIKPGDIEFMDYRKLLDSSRKITNIINQDLVEYSVVNLFRSIPADKDLLKKSQRQALWFVLNNWNFGHTTKGELKVGRAAGLAAELTKYHHGEVSMVNTMVDMCKYFVGSNNMCAIKPAAQFGTRTFGGKDAAAARYSFLKNSWWMEYAFDKTMVSLIPKRMVDGEEAEPEWIPCDIPIGLINGSKGIATGWSTTILPTNPLDVISWIMGKNKGNKTSPTINPWFRNFAGVIEKKTKLTVPKLAGRRKGADQDITDEDENSAADSGDYDYGNDDYESADLETVDKGVVTKGVFTITKIYGKTSTEPKYDVEISELPIGRWTKDYIDKVIMPLVKNDKLESVDNRSDNNNIRLYLNKLAFEPTLENLKLTRAFSMSNMVLINDHGIPRKYDSYDDILSTYYASMLDIYVKFKAKLIEDIKAEIDFMKLQKNFVTLVVEGKIVVVKRKETEVLADMKKYNIPVEIYEKTKVSDLTLDKIEKLNKQIKDAEAHFKAKEVVTPQQMWNDRLAILKKAYIARGDKLDDK